VATLHLNWFFISGGWRWVGFVPFCLAGAQLVQIPHDVALLIAYFNRKHSVWRDRLIALQAQLLLSRLHSAGDQRVSPHAVTITGTAPRGKVTLESGRRGWACDRMSHGNCKASKATDVND